MKKPRGGNKDREERRVIEERRRKVDGESWRNPMNNLSFQNHHFHVFQSDKHLDKHLEGKPMREEEEQRKRERNGLMTKMEGKQSRRECLADKC